MASSIILRNLKQLQKSLSDTINYLDLDYRAVHDNGPFVLRNGQPIINQYKLWLQSSETDYVRSYGYGGFFARNLNEYPFLPSSEPLIEESLRTKTQELFPDIYLVDCEVKCMAPRRFWKVKVIIADKTTGLVMDDMVKNGESIVFNVNSITTQ